METFISAFQVLDVVARKIPLPQSWDEKMSALKKNDFFDLREQELSGGIKEFQKNLNKKQFSIVCRRSMAASMLQALFYNAHAEIRCYDTRETGQALRNDAAISMVVEELGEVAQDFDACYRLAINGGDPFSGNSLLNQRSEKHKLLNWVGFSRQQLDLIFSAQSMVAIFSDVDSDDPPLFIFDVKRIEKSSQILVSNKEKGCIGEALEEDVARSNGGSIQNAIVNFSRMNVKSRFAMKRLHGFKEVLGGIMIEFLKGRSDYNATEIYEEVYRVASGSNSFDLSYDKKIGRVIYAKHKGRNMEYSRQKCIDHIEELMISDVFRKINKI